MKKSYKILIILIPIILISSLLYINSNSVTDSKNVRLVPFQYFSDLYIQDDNNDTVPHSMTIQMIVYNYKKLNEKDILSLSFDNDNIKIDDFKLEKDAFKYKNARLYRLEIDYSLRDDYHENDLKVKNIIVNQSSYPIGDISFHRLDKDYYKSKLSINSQLATSSTSGLDDFYLELENTTDAPVDIKDIDLQSYGSLDTSYIISKEQGENIISQSKIPSDLSIEEKSTVYLEMKHNSSITSKMNDYDVYFFSPIIEYKVAGQIEKIYPASFINSSLASDKKIKELIENYASK